MILLFVTISDQIYANECRLKPAQHFFRAVTVG